MLNNFITIDLHIHSVASKYKEPNGFVDDSNIRNINLLIEKLQKNNINMFSITDHNRFDYDLFSALRESIKVSSVVKKILPGIEFDVELESGLPSCHIVAIFDDSNDDKIRLISECLKTVRLLNGKDEFYTISQFEEILKKINLKTCLIVHQKKELSNNNGKNESLSDSTSNPFQFIQIGYIDCLEFNTSRVEGIVKKSLRNLDVEIPLITGSDCHVWSNYPYNESGIEVNRDFTKIKSLPTFKGLLLSITSFSSRVNRKININQNYIKAISVNGIDVPLENGLNAIIGDNGSGKSLIASLLSGKKTESYYKRIIALNKMESKKCENFIDDQIELISQGSIKTKVDDGKLFEGENTEYYNEISTLVQFERNISNYFDEIITYFNCNKERELKLANFNQAFVEIKPTSGLNFYPTVDYSLNIESNNIYKVRYDRLTEIYADLSKELNNYRNFYENEKLEEYLKTSQTYLKEAISILSIKYIIQEKTIKVKQNVFRLLKEYDDELSVKRTSEERERNLTQQAYTAFQTKITDYISSIGVELIYPEFPKPLEGKSEKRLSSFSFVKTTKYNNENIEESFYRELFNKDYQNIDIIKSLKTTDEIIKALSGMTKYDIEGFKRTKLKSFVDSWKKCSTTISEINGDTKIGNTPGEISLIYYKFKTQNESGNYSVMIIDQPEDDINPKRMNEFLLKYLSTVRDSKQIILITHNPMLVVNLDVDNVIFTKKLNDTIILQGGCLEYEKLNDDGTVIDYSVLDLVKENLDGGYSVIERRLKSYERD